MTVAWCVLVVAHDIHRRHRFRAGVWSWVSPFARLPDLTRLTRWSFEDNLFPRRSNCRWFRAINWMSSREIAKGYRSPTLIRHRIYFLGPAAPECLLRTSCEDW